MSKTNGTVPALADLKEQTRLERARASLARAKQERALCEGLADGNLGPGYGDLLNPFGYRLDPFGGLWLPMQQGGVSAKQDGRNAPFVQSDADLDKMRGLATWLATKNDLAIGILNNLCNFTVHKGYDWDTRPTEGNEDNGRAVDLSAQVKRVVGWHDQHNSVRGRERSGFRRAVRDGDAITRHFRQRDGMTVVRFVGAAQLRDPGNAGPHASFGIETEEDDVETPLHYHVTYNGTDYERVPADDVSHLKRNVDEEVKRGLSDFYSAGDTLEEVGKLLRNMRKGGALLAAIAWIEEYENATRDQLNASQASLKDLNRPQFQHPLTGRNVDYEHYEPGTKIRVQKGKKFLPPPLAGNTTNFTAIVQACLRTMGVRWGLPEYMTSGDASNANMASLLVSGSPTVKSIECQQDEFGALYLRWRWIAVKNACDAGLIRADFAEVEALVDLHFTPPLVAIANELEQSQIDQADITAGALSIPTRQARRKLDPAQERKNNAEYPPTRVSGKATDLDAQGNPVRQDSRGDPTRRAVGDTPVPAQDSSGQMGLRATVGGLQAIQALQVAVYAGQLPREAAIANATTMFAFTRREAEALFPEIQPQKTADQGGPPPGAMGAVPGMGEALGESLEESLAWLAEADWLGENLREAREKGVPFQGPSGRWFVVNDKGRTVPARNPNAQAPAKKAPKAAAAKSDKQPKRTPAEKVAAAKQAVEEHRKAGDHAALTAHLATLSVAEIGALKKDLGIKASGAKAELAKKVAERAIAGAGKAKGAPQPKTGAKWPPDDAARESASADDLDKAQPWLKALYKESTDFLKAAPPAQSQALKDYSGGEHQDVNQVLREGRADAAHPGTKEIIDNLDGLFASAKPFAEPRMVYRGLKMSPGKRAAFFDSMAKAAASGESVEFPEYLSTTISTTMAESFTQLHGTEDGPGVEIMCKKGIYARPKSRYPDEEEVLINRGSKFRVVGVKTVSWNGKPRQVVQLEQES